MATEELKRTVQRLTQLSQDDPIVPYRDIQWPETVPLDAWSMSPELLSLRGTPVFDVMDDAARKRLSFFEAVNFFSLNIHGEKALVEGLAHRLYAPDKRELAPYLHHFLDEENKHMMYFGGFCERYAKKIYSDRKLVVERDYAPGEEDFLFFAKVMIFEEIVDVYNLRMSQDDRLVPIARQINLFHHLEEARHLVFGRQVVKELFELFSPRWPASTRAGVGDYLRDYITATWKEYYNPDVYRDAGLREPLALRHEAFENAAQVAHRAAVTRGCQRFLRDHQIVPEAGA